MVVAVLDPPADVGQVQLAAWLEERLADVVGRLNQAHVEMVEIAAVAAESGAWAGEGLRSLAHWLTWQAGVSSATANHVADVAAAKDTHPRLAETFQRGELTLDQMAVAVGAPVHNDTEFASLAPRCTVSQIRTMVRAASPPADPKDPNRPSEYVRISSNGDGSSQVRARLEADNVKVLEAAIAAARDRLFRAGDVDVTNVDALVDVCRRSMAGESGLALERFRCGIVLDPEDPIRARWSNGTAVPDAIRRHVTCDGSLTPIFTRDAKPVSVGRSQRLVPERTRQVVLRRDRGCRMPWCDRSYGLEIHHVVHWEDGGSTDTNNLIAACGSCHRRHHGGEFHIAGDADDPHGLVFTDRHGRPITRPKPKPPTGPAPPPAKRHRHPLGERLDTSQLWFPPPPEPNPN
jgi:hypothetical protein